jgi:AcrR family transcriptional regulator
MVHLVQVRTDASRNRARILEAARALISARGPDVPMDAIAAEAGVAVGTLYRHHPTKAHLVAAVIDTTIEQFAAAAQEAMDRVRGGADPGEELDGLLTAFAEQHARDRALKEAAAAVGAPVSTDLEDYAAGSAAVRAAGVVEELVAAAVHAGCVRADLTVHDLLTLLNGVPSGAGSEGARSRYLQIIRDGLRPIHGPA